jgi:ATP-dependent exoDNAse (exonuclease V) alpha subunit
MITLNKDQEKASDKIIDFIEGRLNIPYFTLTGGPGTGKTVMLRETLSRTNRYLFDRSAAAVAHSAKNVISESFDHSIPCYTVAQWLGMKMVYGDDGEINFKSAKGVTPKLNASRIAILDEASMINDQLYYDIMNIVTNKGIKLIVVGDIHQLPPVKQDHDSKFFDRIDAELTIPMRFLGPIADLSKVYKDAIEEINEGYAGNMYALNDATNRVDKFDSTIQSGYYFKNNIYELVEQVSDEIKNNPNEINFSRVLAYKNETIDILNKSIREYIYGKNLKQFEKGEIVISKGGFTVNKVPIIHNGKILKVENTMDVMGPYEIPCLSVKFKDFDALNANVVVVKDEDGALRKYHNIKNKLAENARRDPRQWVYYYNFIDSFAYFDYAYSVNTYKAQGQTLRNVYVIENEIMGVKPLSLKQKFQALYVAMTRASKNLYIYNKHY